MLEADLPEILLQRLVSAPATEKKQDTAETNKSQEEEQLEQDMKSLGIENLSAQEQQQYIADWLTSYHRLS